MPNWCDTSIIIENPTEELLTIIEEEVESKNEEYGDISLFQRTLPLGEYSLKCAINTWGTKWELSGVSISIEDNPLIVFISGLTPWSPPNNWALKCSKKYKSSIKVYGLEGGNDFFSRFHATNGEVIVDECYSYLSRESIEHYGEDYFSAELEYMITDIKEAIHNDISLALHPAVDGVDLDTADIFKIIKIHESIRRR